MKNLFNFLLILMLIAPGYSQEIPEDLPKYRTTTQVIVESTVRFSSNFLMVIDQSGSMAGDDVSQAFNAFRMISQQPVDEMQLGVIAFGTRAERWAGIPEPNAAKPVPKGWAEMPSAIVIEQSKKFLEQTKVGDFTNLLAALDIIKLETRKDEFDVIIISDGDFDHGFDPKKGPASSENVAAWWIEQIDEIIKYRKERKLPKFRLHFYGINITPNSFYMKTLEIIAKKYGTFINERRVKGKDE